MKKNKLYIILLILLSSFSWAQTTETFESYTTGKPTTFTSNSQSFTITANSCLNSAGGLFGIFVPGQSYLDCQGVNRTSTGGGYGVGIGCTADACAGSSDKFIENSPSTGVNQTYSIKTTNSALFTMKSIFVYISTNQGASSSTTGGVTFRGKKTGAGTFTLNPTLTASSNGFTFVDFVAAGYGNINIDQLEIQGGAAVNYVALDNFRWGAPVSALTAVTSATNIACNGGNTGRASVTASGGAGGYSYSWAPSGGTASVATGLSAGIYTVTVTDAGSASTTATVLITQPSALVATTSSTNTSCNGGSNGRASVSVSGGTPGYTYSWAPSGGTASLATGLSANNYTVTVTDANNCTRTQTAAVTQPSSITAVTSATAALCNGGSNGAASVSASGGTPTYFYSWAPSGGTGATATGLTAGNYTVTVTDNNSCTRTATIAVTQPSAINTSTSVVNASCFGYANGIVAISVSGGTSPYTYTWSPSGGNSPVATGLVAGSYTVNGRDNNGCTFSRICNVTQPPALVASTSFTNATCNGGSNGQASVSVSGGTPGYTYTWSPSGGNNPLATGLSAGVYTCSIEDVRSCPNTQTVTIGEPTAITTTTAVSNVICNGGSTGSATVTATGGTGAYTYSWTPSGGTAASATGLAAGNYTVTITDANNCAKTAFATIIQPSAIVTSTAVTNVACNGGANGVASVTASGGAGGYSYLWSTGSSLQTITGLMAGVYTATVTDANSCKSIKSAVVTQPSAIVTTTAVTNVACNGGNNGVASITASGGAGGYSYLWSNGGSTSAITGLMAGVYTATVTDANSCVSIKSANVTQPTALVTTTAVTNVACNGGASGSATVTASGGAGGYSYVWSTGGSTSSITGLMAGVYTATVTDANSCVSIKSANVTQPTAIVASTSATITSCNGGSNGTASVTASGGVGAFTYSWTPSGGTAAMATGLAAGNYTVTVTDANNCTKAGTVNVGQPAAITTSTAITGVACNGGANGSATVTATGGTGAYTYSWAPAGGTASVASGLMAGNYTVTVTDANSCTKAQVVAITQPAAISTSTAVTNVLCNGGTNGSATVTATGGTGAYTYSWTPSGGTAAAANGLAQGNYTVTVTDANNCTRTASVTITQPTAISTSTGVTNVLCNGGSTGSATVTATGGTGAYTYSWAPSGGTAASASGLAAGVYTITVRDANNCARTAFATIGQPVAIATSTAVSGASCNGGSNGSATVTATGGTGAYTYSWAPSGGTAASASGLAAGNYTVTVRDANNCTQAAFANVTQPTAISTSTAVTNVLCNGGSTGSATVTATGGTGAYTYSWSPSGGTAASASGLAAGVYTVTVRDANNCAQTALANVTQPTAISTSTAVTNVLCNGGTNGSATVTATGGTGAYTYSWMPSGGTAAAASGLSQGNYTVTVTDANSCAKTATVNVTQPTAIVATPTQTNANCGSNNGAASVSVTGGTGAYTYSWTPSGGTAATATGLGAGGYTVTITDANSCVKTQAFIISSTGNISGVITTTAVSCNGGNNGAASVAASGGSGAYTYTWSPSGGNAATASGLTSAIYTVQVKDATACTVTFTANVTQPTALTVSTTFTNITCNGAANGIATASVSGGTGAYTYTWLPTGGNAATASGLTPATYTVNIKDANNCTVSSTVSVTQPVALSAIISGTNSSCNAGNNGVATVTVSGGTGAYTYSWTPAGGTAATASGLAANNYTVTVKDANLCTITRTIALTEPTALTAVTSQTNVTCNGANNGMAGIVVSGGTGAYTYSWAPAGGTASTATGLAPNNYTVTVKDANNCSIARTYTITQPALLVATVSNTNIACNGAANGIATASVSGGTGAYSYTWVPTGGNAATATGLVPGTYTVNVKDANNCVLSRTVSITEPAALSATISGTNISCGGGTNGMASVSVTGGTGAYTYSWTPSGGTAATATGLAANNYTVTVKDANLCTITRTIALTEPAAMTAVTSQTNLSCNGSNNGAASITVSGGAGAYTYSWMPSGGTAATATGLAANNYTVTVKDANNCSIARTYTITQPTALTVAMSHTNITCNGASNGIASVSVSGGTAAYTYSWTPGVAITSLVTGLNAGTYTVVVTDANLCQATGTVTITQPAALTATSSQTNVLCNGGANASASVTVTGGTGAYSYTWTPAGGNASSATGLMAGNYSVTVKDANNCTLTQTLAITQPATIVATLSHTNISCHGLTNGVASVSATGGTGALTYTWMPGGSNATTINALGAGTYTVNVKDASNCQLSSTVAIVEPAAITFTQNLSICQGEFVTVGTSTYSAAGTYTNILVATGGCDSTVTTVLTLSPPPTLTLTASSTTLCAGTSATLTATGATTYIWTSGVTNGVGFTPAVTQTYTVTGANGGCISTSTITLNVNPKPMVAANVTATLVCSGSAVTLSGTGATTYVWTNGVTNGVAFNPTVTATYTVTGTNTNGCTNTAMVTVSVNPCTGIKSYGESVTIAVYPNPVNSTAKVTISHFDQLSSGKLSLDLFDNTGRMVKQLIIKEAETVLSREGLADGMYYYHISADGSPLLKGKLIVQ